MNEPQQNKFDFVPKMIWLSFLGSQLMFLAIVFMLKKQTQSLPPDLGMRIPLFVLAAVLAIATFLWKNRFMTVSTCLKNALNTFQSQEPSASSSVPDRVFNLVKVLYFIYGIIGWSLAESVCIIGLVLFFTGKNLDDFFYLMAASVVLLLLLRPRPIDQQEVQNEYQNVTNQSL